MGLLLVGFDSRYARGWPAFHRPHAKFGDPLGIAAKRPESKVRFPFPGRPVIGAPPSAIAETDEIKKKSKQ
jgi:hypothetical protein